MTISNEIDGRWIRFDKYGFVNGRVVPFSRTRADYDPWESFRHNEGKYRTVAQPYAALLELNRQLQDLAAKGVTPSSVNKRHTEPQNAADELVLKWCSEYGLLGLLPGLSDSIRQTAQGPEFYRVGGLWRVLSGDEKRVPIGFTWFDSFEHRQKIKPIGELFEFRIDLSAQTAMPCPLSSEFWDEYCEPADEIAYWASVFARAVRAVSAWKAGANSEEQIRRAYWTLDGLASMIAPTFEFNATRNRLDPVRPSPSLLCSFALMFLWDRVEERRAISCENCGAFFVSDEKRARYCSPKCRNRANVRKSTERVAIRKEKAATNG